MEMTYFIRCEEILENDLLVSGEWRGKLRVENKIEVGRGDGGWLQSEI